MAAGAANLLLFHDDGRIEARNTDGIGLLHALDLQAPGWRGLAGPVVILGAGGAARGASAALLGVGAQIRILNRTDARAVELADHLRGAQAIPWEQRSEALAEAAVLINATAAGLEGEGDLEVPFDVLQSHTVVMDMVYKPLLTPLLRQASARGLRTVDGLAMLVGQAVPSFEALFGHPVPPQVSVRALALAALREGPQ